MARSSNTDPRQTFFVFGGIILVGVILSLAKTVLIPIALAILLTFILSPGVAILERRRVPRLLAVIMVVVFSLTLLGAVGWLITAQMAAFMRKLPDYRTEIVKKIQAVEGTGEGSALTELQTTWEQMKKDLKWEADEDEDKDLKDKERGEVPRKPVYVSVANSGWTWIAEAAGSTTENLGSAFLVLVMVFFMLHQRENLRNRIVRLVGRGRIIVTTRALDDGAQRISRYLLMQVFINTGFGVSFALGLALLGVVSRQPILYQYALLFGFMSATLRFIPYLGSLLGSAFVVGFMVATLPGWTLPLIGLGYYLVLETVVAQVIEPLLFGHSTGVSPLALLLAAAFWTWLWGPVGLILSTPLTVMLVVLGKYVPQLEFFPILLGDEPVLALDVRFYQRLLARDTEEVNIMLEEYLQTHTLDDVCEHILMPALLHASSDRNREELNDDELREVLVAMQDVIEDLPAREESAPAAVERPEHVYVIGCPASTDADEVGLHIFARYLQSAGHSVEVLSSHALSGEVVERIGRDKPAVVCVGSVPPGRTAPARYLCKRLRLQYPELKIFVARWGDQENLARLQSRLRLSGADAVATTLADMRAQIIPLLQLAAASPKPAEEAVLQAR